MAVNEELVRQYELLIAVFYAYSRSETKIDEKEEGFKVQIEAKEKEIEEIKQKLEELNATNKSIREKLQEF